MQSLPHPFPSKHGRPWPEIDFHYSPADNPPSRKKEAVPGGDGLFQGHYLLFPVTGTCFCHAALVYRLPTAPVSPIVSIVIIPSRRVVVPPRRIVNPGRIVWSRSVVCRPRIDRCRWWSIKRRRDRNIRYGSDDCRRDRQCGGDWPGDRPEGIDHHPAPAMVISSPSVCKRRCRCCCRENSCNDKCYHDPFHNSSHPCQRSFAEKRESHIATSLLVRRRFVEEGYKKRG